MTRNILTEILNNVRNEVAKFSTERALYFLTQDGYLRWCEGKEIRMEDIKPEFKSYPYH